MQSHNMVDSVGESWYNHPVCDIDERFNPVGAFADVLIVDELGYCVDAACLQSVSHFVLEGHDAVLEGRDVVSEGLDVVSDGPDVVSDCPDVFSDGRDVVSDGCQVVPHSCELFEDTVSASDGGQVTKTPKFGRNPINVAVELREVGLLLA